MNNYKQIIIARKDLNMSAGKLAAQVSHASMAFLTTQLKYSTHKSLNKGYDKLPAIDYNSNGDKIVHAYRHPDLQSAACEAFNEGESFFYIKAENPQEPLCTKWTRCTKEEVEYHYQTIMEFDKGIYENWLNGTFTKIICGARNLTQLIKVTKVAKELGLKENKDYFIIKDNCYTELEPEEIGEDGVGRTVTCIGFVPLPAETAAIISKKYQLY